jgi:hypothetical protein
MPFCISSTLIVPRSSKIRYRTIRLLYSNQYHNLITIDSSNAFYSMKGDNLKKLTGHYFDHGGSMYTIASEQLLLKDWKFSDDNDTLLLVTLENGRSDIYEHSQRSGDSKFRFLKSVNHSGLLSFSIFKPSLPRGENPFSFADPSQSAYTLEVWVHPSQNASGAILAKASRTGREYEIAVSKGRFRVKIGYWPPIDGGPYQKGILNHVAVVVTRDIEGNYKPQIYLNGALFPEDQRQTIYESYNLGYRPPSPKELAKTPLLMGCNIGIYEGTPEMAWTGAPEMSWTIDQALFNQTSGFAGTIAEVRIWKTACTLEQIQANQNRRLSSADKEDGLVGCWRFEEVHNQRVRNLAGDGDHAIIVGADSLPQTTVSSRMISSLVFRQPRHWVNCGNDSSLAISNAATAEFWLQYGMGNGILLQRMGRGEAGYAVFWRNNKIRVLLRGQTPASQTIVETQQLAPRDQAFHHIAFTWDQWSQEIYIYVDGRRQDTVAVAGKYKTLLIDGQYRSISLFDASLDGITAPLYLGSSPTEKSYRRWAMAEVRLWNVARTQNQILNNMTHRLAVPDPSLVGYWRLDDGGKIAHNQVALWDKRSGPEHHGRVQGAQWFPATNSGSVAGGEEAAGDDDDPSHRSDGQSQTTDGQSQTTDGQSQTTDGQSQTTDGQSQTTDGQPETNDGQPETNGGQPKTNDGQSGTNDGQSGTNDGQSGTNGGQSGTNGGENHTLTSVQDIQGHWAQPFIRAVLDRQVMALDREAIFRPNDGVTLGDYVTTIAAAFDQPIQFEAENFSDWPDTDPRHPSAQKAYQMGFFPSGPDNDFDPDQWMNQVDVLSSLVQGLRLKGGTLNLLSGYADTTTLKLPWRLALATALRHGLVIQPDEENRLEPSRWITRAQLAALIYQAWVKLNQAEVIPSNHFVQIQDPPALFVDVPADHWARPYIQGLVDQGITNGYNDGTFRPDLRLSRGDFAVLLVRAFDPQPRPERQQANVSQLFVDVAANDPQTKFIQQIYRSGIMSGLPDRQFGVRAVISRAEAITAVTKVLELPPDHGATHRRYSDHREIPTWATGPIADATAAGLIMDPNPDRIRATVPITRAEVASLIYQGWRYQTQKT